MLQFSLKMTATIAAVVAIDGAFLFIGWPGPRMAGGGREGVLEWKADATT
jgi:hypothetical protein